MASTSSAQTPVGTGRPSLRPSVSSRMNTAFSVEGGTRNNVVQDEHLEEIEAIKRYEVGYILFFVFLSLSLFFLFSLFLVPFSPVLPFGRIYLWEAVLISGK